LNSGRVELLPITGQACPAENRHSSRRRDT
jgi:hypothetical protein